MTTDQVEYAKHLEQSRHNQVGEKETARSNLAQEEETAKHNRNTEAETVRSNLANEKERHRSNKANEKETKRANKAKENEQNRSNLANEAIAKENQEVNKQIAIINAQGRIESAKVQAAANKYIAEQQIEANKYLKQIDQQIASGKNLTTRQEGAMNRSFNATQKELDRATQIFQTITDANVKYSAQEIEKSKLALEKEKAKVDKKYKEGQLKKWQHDTIINYIKAAQHQIDGMSNSISDVLKIGALLGIGG